MQQHEEIPVLIVGGSLVGLSMSLFPAHHGVPHLVAERHRGTSIHPRAAFVTQRTVELYRAVGIEEEEVLAAAGREFLQNGAIVAVDSLGGRELQWFFRNLNEGVEGLSPSPRIFVTQIGLEPVLRERAAQLDATMRYGTGPAGRSGWSAPTPPGNSVPGWTSTTSGRSRRTGSGRTTPC